MNNTDYLISLIFETGNLIRDKAREREKINPLSFARLHVLHFIYEEIENKKRNGPTMKDISERLRITPPSATSLVSGLVTNGELKRIYELKDRRLVRLAITSKGKTTLKHEFGKIKKRLRNVFRNLEEREKKELIKILKRLYKIYQNKL